MKKLMLTAAVLATFVAPAFAEEAASPHSFSGNLTVASDYRFRGISQTFKQPTVQGGFDYAHSSGFYLGNWNSTVSGLQFTNGGSIEMDFYGGYKFEPVKDLTADVGVLYYYYPGSSIGNTGEKYNNTEIYVGASYKWFSAKYSYNVTDFFGLNTASGGGNGDSKGSGYLDLGATFEVAEKTSLGFHVGRQWVKNYGSLNYTDYKVSLSRDFGFATLGLAVVGTNADRAAYPNVVNAAGKSKDVTDTGVVVSISKTF
ncbi:uncharacterized protein (TIGR02001 family) [Paucimonas lemoignei]|uniref:Uncharacterized protein (TIGR02001 family) n=1 Tax=Paucimonas lemoignei TaxID=29443 RepID=A0A4R3HXK8_PAULE|nr:TorF family putative porin [Paucimonas lemoignei]TCS37898.1 uncharacterized protein (TIGR02001 family) [Paucimonas lemoignei]